MLLVNAQESMEVAEHLLKSLEKTKRRMHTMELRNSTDRRSGQYPLIQIGAGKGERYKQLTLGDVQALVDQMPPPAEGGGMWLAKLDNVQQARSWRWEFLEQ